MYISKKTATTLVGSGLEMSAVRRTATKLERVAGSTVDTRKNGAVDEFELAAAVKKAKLDGAEKTALWSAMGSAESANTDGESGAQTPVTRADLKETIRSAQSDLAPLASRGTLTADGLAGHRLANVTVKLLSAAKAEG
jgi:hypothetical protein